MCQNRRRLYAVPTERPSPLRQLVRTGMALALPRRLFMTAGPARGRALALTFDDGPHPVHTPAVLDRLRALGVRATFFVVGARAEAHPDVVGRILADGHAVGHHSWTHSPPGETSAAALAAEARRTAALLERLGAPRPRLYRPPHGKVTAAKLLALWAEGQSVVLWSQDPKDFAQPSADVLRRWIAAAPLAAGDIVLMHDVHPHVAPALDALAGRAAELGLSFTTPAEWLDG